MTTPGSWKQTIPPIQETDEVKASIVNKSINAVAERTDYLRAVLDDVYSAEFIYVRLVAVNAATEQGHLLYWDATNNEFNSAIAKWDDTTLNDDGTLKPADEAVVIGILVNKFTDTTGSIVLNGYLRSFADLTNLFGTATPTAGTYYLSADTAGQVTATTPPLAIMVIVYDGETNLWLPTVRYEHSTHDHKRYELDDGLWLVANAVNFPDATIPTGATYGYDLENSTDEIRAIFTLYPGIAAYTYVTSGDNIPVADVEINESNVWWMDAIAPTDDIYMWLTAPNSHGPNIVRAIDTDSPDVMEITLTNGLATVSKKDFTASTSESGYTVVKDITDENEKKRGDIVEQIVAGEGLDIVSSSAPEDGQGIVELALTEFSSRYIDASIINLNNALQYTVDDVLYTVFPSNRESAMLGVADVPKWTADTTKEAALWFWMRGPAVGGAPLPNISAEVLVFPNPDVTAQAIPAVPETHTLSGAATTLNSMYYLVITAEADRFDVTAQSQVQYKLSLDNLTSNDYLVLRQGILVY